MAGKSNNSGVAVAIQSVADTFVTPNSSTELVVVSALRPRIEGITIANDEYTGSVVKNADAVAGKRYSQDFNIKLRPPAGNAVPAANAFLPGRFLQACKFSEVRTTSAIPASPAALGVGSTETAAVLGTGATGTLELYKGFPLLLSDNGSGFNRQLTMIRHYAADKTAELMEELADPPAANWQIPKFLGYYRNLSASDPILLSMQTWLDGYRFDLLNCRPTSARIAVPTSSRDGANYPELQVTIEGTIYATADDATPALPSLGAVPLFRDGDQHLARKRVGGSGFTIDLGLQTESPPNPNQTDGSDAPEVVASTARVSMTRTRYAKSVIDTLALAEAQAYHPFWAQWGSGAGSMVSVGVPDARLLHPSPDLSAGTITESGDLLIDAIDRSVCVVFPFS